jgi:hypothetical protein
MARRRLSGPERQDEQRGQTSDAAPEHRDRIERRIVGPVDVLEDEHGRSRRQPELGDQQRLDVVRRRTGGQRALERRRDVADQVSNRAERARDREVVAPPEQHLRPAVQVLHEPRHQGRLADPRLSGYENGATGAAGRGLMRLRELGQCPVALEQLHEAKIDPAAWTRQLLEATNFC